MVLRSSSERLAEAMERTRRQWQVHHQKETETSESRAPLAPALTIALSREAGAGGSQVARAVGDQLGWPVYDRELLEQVAGQMGLRANLLEGVDEKRRAWLQECLEAFSSTRQASASGYVRHLVEALLALAAAGECVLVGRGAAQVLPAATTLRIRLVGPTEERIEVIRQRLAISRAEAADRVERTDAGRTQFVLDHFHRDPTNPRDYDLVLNSVRLGIPGCVHLVIEALHQLQAFRGASPAVFPKAAART
jgi:cytidylate kinase